jgi:hypothetical protein
MFHWKCSWAKKNYYPSKKINGILKLMKNDKLGILKNLCKIIGVQLYETIIMYQFHICGLYNSLNF